ncbi:YceI family protein [Oxalobacteraceae bacterium A2-2]
MFATLGACTQMPDQRGGDGATAASQAPAGQPDARRPASPPSAAKPAPLRPAKPAPATPPAGSAASSAATAGAASGTAASGAAAPARLAPLRIDSKRSLIAVTVRRGGLLARLGHDHVVASRHIEGSVAADRNSAEFQFRLDQMTVDEAELRTAAGLDKQPDAEAIEGTRRNMLTKVLDAERYPLVKVRAQRGASAGAPMQVAITLHGVTRVMTIPVQLADGANAITASGTVNLKQTDFGITPFSLFGGALAVQDQLELRFTLAAAP